MPKSPSIPVPAMMSMSAPASVRKASRHSSTSSGRRTNTRRRRRRRGWRWRLLAAKAGSLRYDMREAAMAWVSRARPGSGQTQCRRASGRYRRAFWTMHLKVNSLPRLLVPKLPRKVSARAIARAAGTDNAIIAPEAACAGSAGEPAREGGEGGGLRTRARGREGACLARKGDGGVLLLSVRRLASLVAFSLQYEFEDVVAELTNADRVDADGGEALERSRRAYRLARLATGSRRLAKAVAPRPSKLGLERDYELFFPVFNHAHELFALALVPEWRRRCRLAACFVNELWADRLPGYLLELLAQFDHVFVGMRHAVDEVARALGRPCTYLPLAVDVLRFTPLPDPPLRTIDVCNIGRRSGVTHGALLRLAEKRRLFYYYDTVAASGTGRKQ